MPGKAVGTTGTRSGAQKGNSEDCKEPFDAKRRATLGVGANIHGLAANTQATCSDSGISSSKLGETALRCGAPSVRTLVPGRVLID